MCMSLFCILYRQSCNSHTEVEKLEDASDTTKLYYTYE